MTAKAAYSSRSLDVALDALTKLVAAEPDNPLWYERRGQVLVDLKQFRQALADFEAAVRLQPADYVSLGLLANRGLAHEGLADWTAAVADYDAAIAASAALGFVQPYVLNSRGSCYGSLGRWDEALTDYAESSRAFQRVHNLSGVIYADSNHALALAQLGRDEEATRQMEAVARRAAGSIDMRAALAAQLWATGREAEAEQQWGWACEQINSGQMLPGGPVLDGCAMYRDAGWLTTVRRWPPLMAKRLASFLTLSSSAGAAVVRRAAPQKEFFFIISSCVTADDGRNNCGLRFVATFYTKPRPTTAIGVSHGGNQRRSCGPPSQSQPRRPRSRSTLRAKPPAPRARCGGT